MKTLLPPCRKPVEYFLNGVDKITLEDITSVARRLLTSPLTMASYGDGESYGDINFDLNFYDKDI